MFVEPKLSFADGVIVESADTAYCIYAPMMYVKCVFVLKMKNNDHWTPNQRRRYP